MVAVNAGSLMFEVSTMSEAEVVERMQERVAAAEVPGPALAGTTAAGAIEEIDGRGSESAAAPVARPEKVFARGEFRYPALGDGKPGGGEQVTLLTTGGVPVSGCWQDDGRYVAWAPTPLRDREKEQRLRDMGKRI